MTKNDPKPILASGVPVHCAHDQLVDVTELVANPRNPNKHPDSQLALLAKIIRHQGWRSPVVVSRRSGFIVAGHGRVEAAKLLNVEVVPVNYQHFDTDADEDAHLVADNRIAEISDTSTADLAAILRDLEGKGFDMELAGFTEVDLSEILNGIESPPEPEGGESRSLKIGAKRVPMSEEEEAQLLSHLGRHERKTGSLNGFCAVLVKGLR